MAIVVLTVSAVGAALIVHSRAAGRAVRPANPLPFDLPAQSTLRASSKKVFAHYFSPFPISIDNKDPSIDYYSLQWLTPNGEGGKHTAYGGYLRERPLPQAPLLTSEWQLENLKTEVRRAKAAGLDGFTVNLLQLSGANWDRVDQLYTAAAQVDPSFKLIIMPDSATLPNDPVALADKVAYLANRPATYKLSDGRIVVSPFYAEKFGAAWWNNWLALLRARDITVAFIPCFLDYGSNAAAFAPFSYGFSNWGNRTPASNTSTSSIINDAHARGKLWMQPVAVQDNRPVSSIYWEADNTETLREQWNAAIGGADWVQLTTWNDYSENTQFSPSTHIGWSPLDLSSYYLTRFKMGRRPTIRRDTLYVSHRVQPIKAPVTGGQTLLMNLGIGSTPPRDRVEVLSFLKAPGTLQLTVNGRVTSSKSVPAGITSTLFDLPAGQVGAMVRRSGKPAVSVDSPFQITAVRALQDFTYHFVSSGRQGWIYE